MKRTLRSHWNEFVLRAIGLGAIIRVLNDPKVLKAGLSSASLFITLFLGIISLGIIFATAVFRVWYFTIGRKENKAT